MPKQSCALCERPGHNKRKCPDLVVQKPIPVEIVELVPGSRFIVVETMTEEETGIGWQVDDVWILVQPTGRKLEGYAEWLMRRHPSGRKRLVGLPQLPPFMRV